MHKCKGNIFLRGLLYLFFIGCFSGNPTGQGISQNVGGGKSRKQCGKKEGRTKLKWAWNSLQSRIIESLTQS